MSSPVQRRAEILAQLAAARAGGTNALCGVARDAAGVTGAGIMLMTHDTSHGSICTTDKVSALIEKLQYDLGEGPCIDAFTSDRPVAEPDLASPREPRWVAFTPSAVAAGARAVFGFPLRVGAARLGALNLYCDRPGPLGDQRHRDALIAADVAAHAVLLMQSGAPEGTLAAELDASSDFHLVVHQAAGMVAAQLDVDVLVALIRLRAHAFGSGRDLTHIAQDVVERRLRFDSSPDGPREL